MADRKISDLTALTAPAAGDYLPIVDISEVAAASKNKRITIEELFRGTPDGTAAAPAIAPESDPNTGIYSSGADQLSIATNGTERLRIDSAGQIEAVSLGTAAAPTFSFTGDPNTGIYSPGADQLAISTNGTGRLFVDASGNVTLPSGGNLGINGPAPQSPLDVISNASGQGISLRGRSGDSLAQFRFTSNDHGTIYALLETAPTYLAAHVNGSERMRLTSAGLLGLGTSSPSAKLHIDNAGGTLLSDLVLIKGGGGSGSGNLLSIQSNAADQLFAVNGLSYNVTMCSAGGRVGIGTSSPAVPLTVFASTNGAPAASGTTQTHGAFRISAGNTSGCLDFGPNGSTPWIQATDRTDLSVKYDLLLNPNGGRVGIGTTAPQANLEVSATEASITVGATAPGASGVAGSGWFRMRDNTNSFDVAAIRGLSYTSASTGALLFYSAAGGGLNERARLTAEGYFDFNAPTGQPGVVFKINSSEKARIDSSGRLLVGTSSATNNIRLGQKLAVVNTGSSGSDHAGISITGYQGTIAAVAPILEFNRSRGTTDGSYTEVVADDTLGYILFRGADGAGWSEAASIRCFADGDWTTSGDTTDSPGVLTFSTTADGQNSPTERMRITSDGYVRLASGTGGIQFNGDTAAANALDDYEEGTWTPTIIGSTTAGTATYVIQIGRYTKIGRLVQFEFRVAWNSGTGTGNLVISGLPFTCSSAGTYPSVVIGVASNIALTASNVLRAYINDSSSQVAFSQDPTGGGANTSVPYDGAGELFITGTYSV